MLTALCVMLGTSLGLTVISHCNAFHAAGTQELPFKGPEMLFSSSTRRSSEAVSGFA